MAGNGPVPNPASRRQTGNQAHTWLDLPAGGYGGPVPEWPLVTNRQLVAHLLNEQQPEPKKSSKKKIPLHADADRLDERERVHWELIWRTPQAAAWALNGWANDVALYVRHLTLGEFGVLDSAKEARMWSDRLGLNPAAMLKNRWRVRPDEVAEKRATTSKKPKRRLKAVDNAVARS